jgi:hypothetical protein
MSRIPHILDSRLTDGRDSTVDIATGYWMNDGGFGVKSPGSVKNFLHDVQTGSGAHPASYPMGMWASFSGSKAAGA